MGKLVAMIVRRLALGFLTLLVVSLIISLGVELLPGGSIRDDAIIAAADAAGLAMVFTGIRHFRH